MYSVRVNINIATHIPGVLTDHLPLAHPIDVRVVPSLATWLKVCMSALRFDPCPRWRLAKTA